jgi:hypothetical protein
MIGKFLCKLGFHKWEHTHSSIFMHKITREYKCKRCFIRTKKITDIIWRS